MNQFTMCVSHDEPVYTRKSSLILNFLGLQGFEAHGINMVSNLAKGGRGYLKGR